MELVTVTEAAKRLGVSGETVRNQVRRGLARGVREGGRWLVDVEGVRVRKNGRPPVADAEGWVSVRTAAALVGRRQGTVWAWVKAGLLEGAWVGKARLVDPVAVQRVAWERRQALQHVMHEPGNLLRPQEQESLREFCRRVVESMLTAEQRELEVRVEEEALARAVEAVGEGDAEMYLRRQRYLTYGGRVH
jgi:excisionase family DNA binding protein